MSKESNAPLSKNEQRLTRGLTSSTSLHSLKILTLVLLIASCFAVAVPLFARGMTLALLTVPFALLLIFSMAMKIFVMKTFRQKIAWYVLDSILLVLITFFSGWNDESVVSRTSDVSYLVYICTLTEFYLSAPELRASGTMFGCNLALYTILYSVCAGINNELSSAFDTTSHYFVALIVMCLHFGMITFAIVLAKKNKQIEDNLRELEQNRNELLIAYNKLEQATLLEERNRIAKEIHDTTGHSLTTVIMQTEAAKLNMDKDPVAAKRSITAANMQAKTCLEQLRVSVHLLSGRRENVTLKEYLEGILEETAEGTGLSVRSKIDDLELTDEAERFVANSLREGIVNGSRHGGGTAFLFELKDKGTYVSFLLSDNGSGVDMKNFQEGFGLSGMRKRAESLGGMIQFLSEPDEGFEIEISLPASVKKIQEGEPNED